MLTVLSVTASCVSPLTSLEREHAVFVLAGEDDHRPPEPAAATGHVLTALGHSSGSVSEQIIADPLKTHRARPVTCNTTARTRHTR